MVNIGKKKMPKTPFLYKGKKTKLYIQNVGHIWAYIHANSQDF